MTWLDKDALCDLPRTGTRWDITFHARGGCGACLLSPRNLDPLYVDDGPVDVDGGETRCPRGCGVVWVRAWPDGQCSVLNPDGSAHRHTPFAGVRLRMAPSAEPNPAPWHRWDE